MKTESILMCILRIHSTTRLPISCITSSFCRKCFIKQANTTTTTLPLLKWISTKVSSQVNDRNPLRHRFQSGAITSGLPSLSLSVHHSVTAIQILASLFLHWKHVHRLFLLREQTVSDRKRTCSPPHINSAHHEGLVGLYVSGLNK